MVTDLLPIEKLLMQDADREFLTGLRIRMTERLKALKFQEATYGINAPAEIVTEIQNLEQRIKDLTAQIEIPNQSPASQHPISKQTILVVEDDTDIRNMLQYFLSLNGYSVLIASNGVEGIHYAKEYHPELMLIDIMMPQMNGMEMIAAIRDALIPTRIVILTAVDAQTGIIGACLRFGASSVLFKPIEFSHLLDIVKKTIEIEPTIDKIIDNLEINRQLLINKLSETIERASHDSKLFRELSVQNEILEGDKANLLRLANLLIADVTNLIFYTNQSLNKPNKNRFVQLVADFYRGIGDTQQEYLFLQSYVASGSRSRLGRRLQELQNQLGKKE